MSEPFRCAVTSEADDEVVAGTAPTETRWLMLERPGAWGRKAVTDSGLPDEVVAHLQSLPARVQLLRRPDGRASPGGVRVFSAGLDGDADVRTAVLTDVRDLPDLAASDLTPYAGDLWLVCTNGRRDVCCAERGRPIAAALAARDPEATWETTHLGGHRFAGTLLHLPTGLALGRLDAGSAAGAADTIAAGLVPLDVARGRAGWPARAQYADLYLRREHGWLGLDDVRLLGVERDVVELKTPAGPMAVTVRETAGPQRRSSCADVVFKPTTLRSVEGVRPA